jgi:putative DNA-invertase from lambdoid prophage Rac
MAVFGYSRVSLQKQADDGCGLDVQRRIVEGYAMIQGWTIDEMVIEQGVSGSIRFEDRPEGSKLIARLRKGDTIIASKLDRLFRSARDALNVVEELKAKGVSVHVIDLHGDITNGIAKIFMTITAAFAEMERERISDRLKETKSYLSSQGIFNGGKRPFGYDIVQDGDVQRMVPRADEQAIIETMKTMKAAGASLRAIGAVTGHQATSVKRILERVWSSP